MTLADYFQPLGLNFLQSPIQLTPPHPYSPAVHKVLQMFDYVSTSFPFLPSCVLESWLTKNNNNNKLQLNSVNTEVGGGGMESVRVNGMSVD